jgi:hypothetical protein
MDHQDNRPDGQQGDNQPQHGQDSSGCPTGPGVPGQQRGSADVSGNRQRESNPDEDAEGTPDGNPGEEGSDGVGHALRQGRGQFEDETFDRNTSPEGSEPEELAPGSSTDGASIISPSGERFSPG